jgi:hypothetical protein
MDVQSSGSVGHAATVARVAVDSERRTLVATASPGQAAVPWVGRARGDR